MATVWLTGLSGAGKTTLATALADALASLDVAATVVDGDAVRAESGNYEYDPASRSLNVQRICDAALSAASAGRHAVVACISPFAMDRELARRRHIAFGVTFYEVHVNTPLAVCEARDPKGLYRSASEGKARNVVGIDLDYEEPVHPDLRIDTSSVAVMDAMDLLTPLISGTSAAYANFAQTDVVIDSHSHAR